MDKPWKYNLNIEYITLVYIIYNDPEVNTKSISTTKILILSSSEITWCYNIFNAFYSYHLN